MNIRIKWLRDQLKSMELDGMIVSNPINVKYLTGIEAEGILLITSKENIYITDSRYIEEVHSTLTIDDEIMVCNYTDVSSYDYENFFSFCENVGFEENAITYAPYKNYLQKYKVNSTIEYVYNRLCVIARDCFGKEEQITQENKRTYLLNTYF